MFVLTPYNTFQVVNFGSIPGESLGFVGVACPVCNKMRIPIQSGQ